jgi:hypothetical protein
MCSSWLGLSTPAPSTRLYGFRRRCVDFIKLRGRGMLSWTTLYCRSVSIVAHQNQLYTPGELAANNWSLGSMLMT